MRILGDWMKLSIIILEYGSIAIGRFLILKNLAVFVSGVCFGVPDMIFPR